MWWRVGLRMAGGSGGAADERNTRRAVGGGGVQHLRMHEHTQVHYNETHRYARVADSIHHAEPASASRAC